MKASLYRLKFNYSAFLVILLLSVLILMTIPIPVYGGSTGNITVSSSKMFGKMVVQVTVSDADLAGGAVSMPLVTVDKDVKVFQATVSQTGRQLPMYQAVGGSWIGYVTLDQELTDIWIPAAPPTQDNTPPAGGFDSDGIGHEITSEPDIVGRPNQRDNDGNPNNDVDVHNIIATITASEGDIITITYHDADPPSLVSKEIAVESTQGSISLDRLSYPVGAKVDVSVTDQDENLDPTASDSIPTDAITLSGVTGADAADQKLGMLNETGPNTGVFTSSTTIPDAKRLEVLQLAYDDADAPDGHHIARLSSAIITANTGIITLDKEFYSINENAKIRLSDPDLNLDSASIESTPSSDIPGSVKVTSSTDVKGFIVVLQETGRSTGIFEKTIGLQFGEPPSIPPNIKVFSGDTISVTYTDALRSDGTANVKAIATATIKTFTGILSLDRSVYSPGQIAKITLTDPDENLDPNRPDVITSESGLVDVRSVWTGGPEPGRDGPFNVTLIESAPNTSKFGGTFNVELELKEGVPGPSPILRVVSGCTIIVTYHDRVNAEGVKGGPPEGITDQKVYASFRTNRGILTLDKDSYVPGRSPSTPQPYVVPDVGELIIINVADPDLNINPDAFDQYNDPNMLLIEVKDPYGNLRPAYFVTEVTELLKETGPNTGIFKAEHSLRAGVQPGDVVTVYYKDKYDEQGNAATIKHSATIATHTGQVSIDKTKVKETGKITVTVEDQDWNFNPDKRDIILPGEVRAWGGVDVWTTTTGEVGGRQISLTETGPDTGIFNGTFTLGIDIKASIGDTVTVRYNDEQNDFGMNDRYAATAEVEATTGEVTLDKPIYPLNGRVIITVDDPDRNSDPARIESIRADEVTARTTSWTTPNVLDENLIETGLNTGVFNGSLQLRAIPAAPVPQPEAGVVYSSHGDGLTVTYTDPRTNVPVSATAMIKATTATVKFDKSLYQISETAIITLTDPDENRNSYLSESMKVTVFSTSDPVGLSVKVLETGPDTGVFVGKIGFSTGLSDVKLEVSKGDEIKVTYLDENPNLDDVPAGSKYAQALDLAHIEAEPKKISLSNIVLWDVNGNPINEVKVGVQILIVTSISNNASVDEPLLYIVQIKDSGGEVVDLSFMAGTLPASQTFEFGTAWTPPAAGDYLIEAFAWRSWKQPEALSETTQIKITVQ